MASKSRGGLSKREYASKVSSQKKTTSKSKVSKPSSKSTNIGPWAGGYGSEAEYGKGGSKLTNIGPWAAGYGSEQEFGPGSAAAQRQEKQKKSKSKSKSRPSPVVVSPQRIQAADAYNGEKTIFGSTDSKTDRPSTIAAPTGKEKGYWSKLISDEARSLMDRSGFNPYKGIKNLAEDVYTGFKTAGGLVGTARAMDEDSVFNTGGVQQDLRKGSLTDEQLNTIIEERAFNDPNRIDEIIKSTGGTIVEGDSRAGGGGGLNTNVNISRSNTSNDSSNDSGSDNRRSNPTRVNPTTNYIQPAPIQQSRQTEQDNSLQNVIAQLQPQQSDQTPIFNNPGTTRRPFGNGSPMSNGAFSNGKGHTGLEGATLGMNGDVDNETNLINQLLGIKTAQASDMPQTMNTFQSLYNQNPLVQAGQRLSDQAYMSQNTSPAFRPDTTPRATGGGYTGGSQGQGGGMAPQGIDEKALAKQYGLSGYKDQYRAQEKANKQAQRDLAAALQNTIAQINSQYAESQTEGQGTLDKAKQEDLLKLSGLFNFANQDPNSEQRIQYQQRTNDDYAGQLTDLINKLTRGKEQDVLGAQANYNTNSANYRQQGQDALNQIQSAKSAAKQNLAQLIYQMQQDQANRAVKSGGRTSSQKVPATQKLSHQDIFDYVNDAVSQGGSWQEIVSQAKDNGVDTSTGSYIDQLLNRQFRG